MALFHRRSKLPKIKKRPKMKPFVSSSLPESKPPSLEEATHEGLQLMNYASRMSLKNRILVDSLGAGQRYDKAHHRSLAREVLELHAAEAEVAAARLSEAKRWSAATDGRARHAHDYRSADFANLKHRLALSEAIAQHLREQSQDEEFLDDLVVHARDDAWHEVAFIIGQSLDRSFIAVDERYLAERDERMRRLVEEDLTALLNL